MKHFCIIKKTDSEDVDEQNAIRENNKEKKNFIVVFWWTVVGVIGNICVKTENLY